MTDLSELHDNKFQKLLESVPDDITDDRIPTAVKALETFSKTRPQVDPEPETISDPVPMTRFEKVRAGIASVWDNETTRAVIKAGGAFAGVAYVTHATIKKDHVLERQALAQANTSQPR
jgi:hypothetical protein